MTIICLIAVRRGSERLPSKSLVEIAGQPLLGQLLDRLQACHVMDGLVVATTDLDEDDPIADHAQGRGVSYFRGSLSVLVGNIMSRA